jgi:hypothetical protein
MRDTVINSGLKWLRIDYNNRDFGQSLVSHNTRNYSPHQLTIPTTPNTYTRIAALDPIRFERKD